jgi:predicted amidohydrolase YtcJ
LTRQTQCGLSTECSEFQPLLGIKACRTERTSGGAEFAPAERIPVERAIALYTSSGAYASFQEGLKGTITPGKLADFAVLGADPCQVELETLDRVPVLATMRGGEIVYEAPVSS